MWDYTFYIWRYARHPEKTPLEKRYRRVRGLIVYVLDHFRLDWKVEDVEKLRALEKSDTKFLLVSNHLSDLDPLAIVYLCEKPISFVAKKETRKMPFIGTAVKAIDGLFMDRADLRQSFEVIQTVEERLHNGYCSYMIFPEGTRNRQPETTPVANFHAGSFKAAMAPSVPILPMAEYGTFRPFHSKPDYRRNPLEVTFYDPLMPADYQGLSSGELAQQVHDLLDQKVVLFKAEDKDFFDKGYEKVPLHKGPLR